MHHFQLLIICLCLSFSSCSTPQDIEQKMKTYTFSSLKDLDLDQSGFNIIKDKDRSNNDISYGIYIPENINKEKLSVILALHWSSQSSTFQEFAECLIVPVFKDYNSIIIVPDAQGPTWFTVESEQVIKDMMTTVYASLPIEKERAIVTGYSDGGNMSLYLAEYHSDLFSYAIPMATAYQSDGLIALPSYIIHGQDDDLFDVSNTEKFILNYKKKGAKIKWKTLEGLSHFEACNYTDALKEAKEWVKKEYAK